MSSSQTSSATCSAAACGKPATLRCPTCKELGIGAAAGSAFCSSDCFKASWDAHKGLHRQAKEALAAQISAAMSSKLRLPSSFDGYRFSGKLRPGIVSPRMSVPSSIRKPDYADGGVPHSELVVRGNNVIPVLTEDAREHMRKACR